METANCRCGKKKTLDEITKNGKNGINGLLKIHETNSNQTPERAKGKEERKYIK